MRSPWYLFNDFVVQNISEEEALSFPGTWKVIIAEQSRKLKADQSCEFEKVPCLLYLERQDVVNQLDFTGLPSKLDPGIIGHRYSVAQ